MMEDDGDDDGDAEDEDDDEDEDEDEDGDDDHDDDDDDDDADADDVKFDWYFTCSYHYLSMRNVWHHMVWGTHGNTLISPQNTVY